VAVKSLQLRIRADKSGPEPDFAAGESWPLLHAELMAPAPKQMDIPEKTVQRGLKAGWCSLTNGEIRFHLEKDDLVYKIIRHPGRYLDGKETEEINNPAVEVYHDYKCRLVTP
jgi:hypothetical protein